MLNFYRVEASFMQIPCRWHEWKRKRKIFNSRLNASKRKIKLDLWSDGENSLPFNSTQVLHKMNQYEIGERKNKTFLIDFLMEAKLQISQKKKEGEGSKDICWMWISKKFYWLWKVYWKELRLLCNFKRWHETYDISFKNKFAKEFSGVFIFRFCQQNKPTMRVVKGFLFL